MTGTSLEPGIDSEAGFSLLETIAALAILSMALVPLLALQFQLASGAARLEQQSELSRAVSVARVMLSTTNPAIEPEGRRDLGGGWQVSWTSQPVGPPEVARYGLGVSSRHRMQVFRVTADVVDEDSRTSALVLQTLGWVETAPFGFE